MSADVTMSGRGDALPVPDEFITDESGRRLFYPFGLSWSGYVVPDAARERMLRSIVERFRNATRRVQLWPALIIVPCYGAASVLLETHPFWFLAALVVPVLIAVIVPQALLNYQIRGAVDGLQQARRRDNRPAYMRQVLLAGLALTWVTLQLYYSRLSSLPAAPGTTIYYPDISEALVLALLCGFFALALATMRNSLRSRFSGSRIVLVLLFFAAATTGLVTDAALSFLNPSPKVAVSADGLFCGWRARWANISDLSQAASWRRGAHYAVLTIGSEPNFSIWSAGNVRRCRITGLNEDYETVYHTIRIAWLATRSAPVAAANDPTGSDQIAVGASRAEVIGVFGQPKLSARTPDGAIALYYSAGGDAGASNLAAASGPVLVVYFDTNDRVERVGRYSVHDGKIFDSVTNKRLTGGYEYPLLFMILIDKSHGR